MRLSPGQLESGQGRSPPAGGASRRPLPRGSPACYTRALILKRGGLLEVIPAAAEVHLAAALVGAVGLAQVVLRLPLDVTVDEADVRSTLALRHVAGGVLAVH